MSEGWRWNARQHVSGSYRPTIVVADLSDEEKAERERKIADGAQVLPFGFGRVLAGRDEQPDPAAPAEPHLWDGDYA